MSGNGVYTPFSQLCYGHILRNCIEDNTTQPRRNIYRG